MSFQNTSFTRKQAFHVFPKHVFHVFHKYGAKFFELCTNDGLVLHIQIYSGIKFTNTESLGQTGSIVLHLMEPYLNKGYRQLVQFCITHRIYAKKEYIYYWHLVW